ncbi:MAG: hypothetical protein JWN03_255 [Nocardia sp.]|uniref:TetR/AcrR family transcriptional regulator n=1 Tax=Nocardia sp. TaxID=1821 RepID=UPI00262DCC2C|nr:TetR/AcrR family transcriptional regulator [Nocardia sp.]MCU1639980.1 hypothetical protein [Nocardia sp.]
MTAHHASGAERSAAESDRAERILAAAHELLLSWGYKRVTIDDIARHARVGKGTVYLHWKTKEQLFTTLLQRECATQLDDLIDGIRRDPTLALPHNLFRDLFLGRRRNPLARAIHEGNSEVLGALAVAPNGQPVTEVLGVPTTLADLVATLRRHRLLVDDGPESDQVYAIDAIITGFFLGGNAVSPEHTPDPARQADLLATAIHRTFEPETAPDTGTSAAAARAVIADLDRARDRLTGE